MNAKNQNYYHFHSFHGEEGIKNLRATALDLTLAGKIWPLRVHSSGKYFVIFYRDRHSAQIT